MCNLDRRQTQCIQWISVWNGDQHCEIQEPNRVHAYMDISSSRRRGLTTWLGEHNHSSVMSAYLSLLTIYIHNYTQENFKAMTEIWFVLMLWPICYRNRHLSKVQNVQRSTCDKLIAYCLCDNALCGFLFHQHPIFPSINSFPRIFPPHLSGRTYHNVKCFSTSQRHTLCAIGVRYCEIESNEVQGIPRYWRRSSV